MIDRNDSAEISKYIEKIISGKYSRAKQIFSTVTTRYFRSRHAERTRDILMREAQDSTINNILPVRLRKTVAEIDYCHGTLWQEILKRLPWQDNGLHTDYIHPQFIAALLRLGDLLDLDSNRFNPYQIENAGKLPRDSAVHILKNTAITKFMVDPSRIDIEARFRYEEAKDFLMKHYFQETKSKMGEVAAEGEAIPPKIIQFIIEESANTLRNWISWLHDDLKEFSHNWSAIIPNGMTGYIAALRKSDIYIDDSDKPVESDELELRYSISPRRASQIIEGSELYNDSLVFIRELVQNSIDTTKRQIYKHLIMQSDTPDGQNNPFQRIVEDPMLTSALKKYKVRVKIKYKPKYNHPRQTSDELVFTFQDYGIGITYEKLKQMRHIGSVSLSDEERKERREMPPWLLPTGEYGIGMQSVFTVVDSFDIETYPRYEKYRETDYQRSISLFCPELGGDIVNEECPKPKEKQNRFGSDVMIHFPLNRENVRKLMQYKEFSTFDIRSEKVLDIEGFVQQLKRYIFDTFTDDIVSLDFSFERDDKKRCQGDEESKPQPFASFSFPDYSHHAFKQGESVLFVKNSSGASSVDPQSPLCYWFNGYDREAKRHESVLLTLRNSSESRVRLYYRGIVISSENKRYSPSKIFRIPGVDLQINIMSGSAGELLEISRDYIKPAGYKLLRDIVQHALRSFYQAVYNCVQRELTQKKGSVQKEDANSEKRKDLHELLVLRNHIYSFFFQNPTHLICLFQVLHAFREDLDDTGLASFTKKMNERCQPGDAAVPTLSTLYGRAYFSSMTSQEALQWMESGNIWFTDFRFEDSFCSYIDLQPNHVDRPPQQQDALTAMYDNLSGVYDFSYGKVRILQDKAWKTQYIMLYTLVVKTDSEYPEFIKGEFERLCLLIVNEYIDRYASEKDGEKKEEIGNYILSFPAVKDYHKIAVSCFPAETPDELARRFSKFIICPCNVKKLAEYFDDRDAGQGSLAYLSKEKRIELFEKERVKDFIHHKLSLIRQDLKKEALDEQIVEDCIEQYEKLFASFGRP